MKLLKRIIVAVIFIPIILFLFYKGEISFIIFLSLIDLVMFIELRNMFRKKDIIFPILSIPVNLVVFLLLIKFDFSLIIPSFLIIALAFMGYDIFKNRLKGAIIRGSSLLFSILYISFMLSCVYKLRQLENGNILLISLICMIWITDSFAYFIGNKFGKHKGIIKASPNKSLEGFIAGFCFTLFFAFALYHWQVLELTNSILLVVAVGIFGQLGDIFESMLKRDVGVKDSSYILPGHGGVLDRFDSLLIAAPIFYYLSLLI